MFLMCKCTSVPSSVCERRVLIPSGYGIEKVSVVSKAFLFPALDILSTKFRFLKSQFCWCLSLQISKALTFNIEGPIYLKVITRSCVSFFKWVLFDYLMIEHDKKVFTMKVAQNWDRLLREGEREGGVSPFLKDFKIQLDKAITDLISCWPWSCSKAGCFSKWHLEVLSNKNFCDSLHILSFLSITEDEAKDVHRSLKIAAGIFKHLKVVKLSLLSGICLWVLDFLS